MRRFRALSSGLDKFFAAQFSAGYITNMSGFDLRQAPALKPAFTAPEVWQHFDPGKSTLCSPDPQALRPPKAAAA